jgi:hypothetical protein
MTDDESRMTDKKQNPLPLWEGEIDERRKMEKGR